MRYCLFAILMMIQGLRIAAQSATPVANNAGGGSYNDPASYIRYFDWSIGELTLINTVSAGDSSVVVYQGVLQPGTEKPGLTVFSADFTAEDFKLFPNPTVGKFEINFFLNERGRMDLELTDALGKVMERRSFNYGGCCRIVNYDISKLPPGIYFIVATLQPEPGTLFNTRQQPRRSGLRIVKMNP